MSSDEEATVGLSKQYNVIQPAWRSDAVTSWLRMFDALHWKARIDGLYGDQRGAIPRTRVGGWRGNPGGDFVKGLPRNAYDDEWFNNQAYPEYDVQPGPSAPYFHDGATTE